VIDEQQGHEYYVQHLGTSLIQFSGTTNRTTLFKPS